MKHLHNRSYFKNSRSIGADYEDYFEKFPEIIHKGKKISFKDLKKEPFKISSKAPYICATPDFIGYAC